MAGVFTGLCECQNFSTPRADSACRLLEPWIAIKSDVSFSSLQPPAPRPGHPTRTDVSDGRSRIQARGHPQGGRHPGELPAPLEVNGANTMVYFDIQLGRYGDATKLGRIVMELKDDVTPKTAENFKQLCLAGEGAGYKGSRFHRVIPSFM